jgi:hypothetical protein
VIGDFQLPYGASLIMMRILLGEIGLLGSF